MAWLLAHAGEAETVRDLRRVLDDDERDAFYELTAPLLDRSADMQTLLEPDAEVRPLLNVLAEAAPTQAIAEGFARLTRHAGRLEKTAFLQRAVAFGGFGLYLHVTNSTEAGREEGRLAPMLLCTRDASAEAREASRRTYARGKRRIVEAFEERLAERLRSRGDDGKTRFAYVDQMRGWLLPGGQSDAKQRAAERALERFENDFDAERAAVDTDFEAFVRALREASFSAKKVGIGSKGPVSAMFYLGKHSGLLGPFRGPGEKYYRPEPQMLDTLVAALLEPEEEGITEQDFWQRAYESFGVLCGARGKHDVQCLRDEWDVRGASAGTLEDNAGAVREQLRRLGYARTYADGATLISASA